MVALGNLPWCCTDGTSLAGSSLQARLAFCKPQCFVGWNMSHRGSQSPITPSILYPPSHFNFSESPYLTDVAF